MGQTLSEPVVEKNSDDSQDERLAYGVSSMQGWRITMEDAHACVLDLRTEEDSTEATKAKPEGKISFFGVYDGHGGDKVAIYTGINLHKIIAKQEAYKKGDIEQALKDGFLATDRAILEDPKYQEEVSGCTASVGVITNDKIYAGNAGDSRAVLGIKGRAKPLSFDHKPQNEGEKARINAAGGFVDFGRVNGNLALSRAIGDFEFKKSADLSPESQIVTAFPDVTIHEISGDDEFLVIACDGIWDCQSSQAVTEFVRRGIAAKQELSAICENMMDNCLASNSETGGVGCDNMTMIVIALLNGKTKEEWYKDIADRVANGDGPCAPPEYAEFRGPGQHRQFDNSPDENDMDIDQRSTTIGGRGSRIILLGDGSEAVNNSDQQWVDEMDGSEDSFDASDITEREDTPAPEPAQTSVTSKPTSREEEQQTNHSTDDKKQQSPSEKSTSQSTKEENLTISETSSNST